MAADGDPSSIITQVSRDEDSYAPCPAPISSKGSINTTTTTSSSNNSKRGIRSFCVCQWLFSCFRSDETTPINSVENETIDNAVVSSENALLPPLPPSKAGRKCVVIDLDETLVHSSFRPVPSADFVVSVDIEGIQHQVYVQKRPHVDEFLRRMGEMFECVLFTASLAKYADPVTDLLDKWNTFDARLFRESCVYHRGNYVKDLSKLGRDITQCCIIDNSPQSYIFHPDNAIPVTSWFDDPNDTELLDLIPFFEALEKVDSVLTVLGQNALPSNSLTDESRTATPPANYAQQT